MFVFKTGKQFVIAISLLFYMEGVEALSEYDLKFFSSSICAQLKASPVAYAPERIALINELRYKLHKDPFTGNNSEINLAIILGICEQFVLDALNYEQLLNQKLAIFSDDIKQIEQDLREIKVVQQQGDQLPICYRG